MKLRAFFLLAVVVPLSASLANAETIGEALNECKQTDNSLKRLMCYDKVVKQMNQYDGANAGLPQTALPLVTSGTRVGSSPSRMTAATTQSRKQEPATEFGLEHKRDTSELADEMTSVIIELSEYNPDKYTITLENGSVWQQTERSTLKLKANQSVVVKRGLFGAFFLGIEGVNKRVKVKRIK